MKKLLCFVTSIAMCGLFALNVNASEGISTEEQKIIDTLNAGVSVEGTKVAVPSEYINQAETFLKTNDVEASVVDAILEDVEAVKSIIINNKITDLKDIKGSVASEIFVKAQAAAAKVGVTLNLNADNTVDVLDKDGKKIFTAGVANAIKNTGDDYSIMYILTGAIAIILIGSTYVAEKKGFLNK